LVRQRDAQPGYRSQDDERAYDGPALAQIGSSRRSFKGTIAARRRGGNGDAVIALIRARVWNSRRGSSGCGQAS
jgi:hypothetical protein